jgi:uncharacterized protein YdhG (YjbR/CyaY superfamily)
MESREYASIDDYILSFPEHTRKKLSEMRGVIQEEAPAALEKISYRMPTFYLNGNLVHFAGYAKHIGFYPGPSGVDAIKDRLSKYCYAKGSIQFPLDEPLPLELIREIVRFRVKENSAKKKPS